MKFDRKRVALVVIISVIILGLVGIFVLWISSVNRTPQNVYGNKVVAVKDLDTKISDLPDYLQVGVTNKLYQIISLNLAPGAKMPTSIDDAVVRANSTTQSQPDQDQLYIKTLIIDIPSLRQSYGLTYEYSSDANTLANLTDLYVVVSCLQTNQLIYGDFSCKNTPYQAPIEQDPVLNILPYSTLEYEIKASVDTNEKVSLNITLFPTNIDYQTGIAAAVASYKQDALSWLTSQNINPANYPITYSY